MQFRQTLPCLTGIAVVVTAWSAQPVVEVIEPAAKTSEQASFLDQRTLIVLGQLDAAELQPRLAAAHALPEDLNAEDAEALFQGILAPVRAVDLPDAQWAALYNDVLNALNALREPWPDYSERLLGLIRQPEREVVLRDYALQHLLSYAQFRLDGDARRELLDQAGEAALAAPGTTLPGTYLLGIYQMAGQPGYPSTDAIAADALALAEEPDAFTPNRITAIQVCGQLGYTQALPLARKLARDTSVDVGVRMAAIATIGNVGGSDYISFLRKVRHSSGANRRLIYAVDNAIQRLQNI